MSSARAWFAVVALTLGACSSTPPSTATSTSSSTSGATSGAATGSTSGSTTGGAASTGSTTSGGLVPLALTNVFTPNAVTISTSEGAPYGDCDFWLDAPTCVDHQSNFGYGPTKVIRLYVCLSGEVSTNGCSQQPAVTGPLSTTMVSDFASRLAGYAGTGVRLMVRFTYNFGPIGPTAMDAQLSVILGHLAQLAPVLIQNQDLIFALEAGFIGTWGEWHDSTNGNDTAAAQKSLLDAELASFGGLFPILVRYPADLVQYLGSSTPSPSFGLHDDYYASSPDDGATWNTCDNGGGWCFSNTTAAQLMSFAAAVSSTTMFVGEFGALDPTLQACPALAATSQGYNLQSLSLTPYPLTIGGELEDAGCALSFFNQVGTRIELQEATLSGLPVPGGQLQFGLTLSNAGFGRVIRARPATIVFKSDGDVVAQSPIPLAQLDLRQLAASANPTPQMFQFTVDLPSTFPDSGSVTASLLIPDPAPSLTNLPAYALPLNSLDADGGAVFHPDSGLNRLATFEAE